jgi:hypothetical protein
MEQKTKTKKQSTNEIVYKCNSKHCKESGFHNKEDMRTITLKLTIGKDCPLDFEDAMAQVVTRAADAIRAEAPVVQPNPPQNAPRKSVVPQGLIAQGLQMRPPKDA